MLEIKKDEWKKEKMWPNVSNERERERENGRERERMGESVHKPILHNNVITENHFTGGYL